MLQSVMLQRVRRDLLLEQQLALVANPKAYSSPYIFYLELTFLPHGPPLIFLFFSLAKWHVGILVPQPGTEPMPTAVEAWILNH